MANIVIKKKVSLEFLGDEYKDSYILFKVIPISEYRELIPKIDAVEKRLDLIELMLEVLKDKFIEGKILEESTTVDMTNKDLESLDEATLSECFAYITGQKISPK